MEIILKQDIPNLGYTNDLIKVKNGYARNYLIPKGLAILATEPNKKIQAEVLKQKSYKEEKIRKEAETLAKAIENINVKIGAKAGTSGKIFGSVNTIQLAEAINKKGFTIDRKQISLPVDTIKEVGTYTAKIKLHKTVVVDFEFEVVAE